MRETDIIDKLNTLPSQIKEVSLKLLEITEKIPVLKKEINVLRKETALAVANDTSAGRKNFPNAETREIETQRRLDENEQYQTLANNLEALEHDKAILEIELKNLNDEFSSNRYKAKMFVSDKTDAASYRFERAANSFHDGLKMLNNFLNSNIINLPGFGNYQDKNREENYGSPEDVPF